MKREKETDKPVFDFTDRTYNVKAWYAVNTETEKGDAIIEIKKDGHIIREFIFPAYKIWNIAAHFSDIVDGELEKLAQGYQVAASDGLGGHCAIKPNK